MKNDMCLLSINTLHRMPDGRLIQHMSINFGNDVELAKRMHLKSCVKGLLIHTDIVCADYDMYAKIAACLED